MRRKIQVLLALVFAIGLSCLVGFSVSKSSIETSLSSTAPQPLLPTSAAYITTSDVTLRWSWAGTLNSNQIFALRLWYENHPFIEVWTHDTFYNAQALIDSYSRDIGTFYWQVIVVEYSSANGYEKVI